MIVQAERKQGLVVNPGVNKTKDLIKLNGPGVFVSMHVTKQGGVNDITQVALYIDGKNVVAITYAAARNIGLNKSNNSGIMMSEGPVDTISVQFNEPLLYRKELRVEIKTGSDAGVVQIVANAVTGKNCSYPA
ncbi:MAG: hypothetical protein M3R36_08255 [Bacteroidota bacterium]|nr:hypothetical protein [Bacteroidota bacterium]